MRSAGRREGEDFVRIEDRRTAIRTAFACARAGDLVLLTGKGHEQSIIVGRTKTPWDERRVAREELAALGYRQA
jgi:UDP-N-acetylmuramoyl-L-alanyl-D-glutamate--2,6-diaminopimelate ligase